MYNPSFVRIFSASLLIVGFFLSYVISRRRFNRRSITGLQGFRSYDKGWRTLLFERIVKGIARILIVVGIILFAITFIHRTS